MQVPHADIVDHAHDYAAAAWSDTAAPMTASDWPMTLAGIHVAGASITMMLSVMYHLFMAATTSKAAYTRLLMVDVVGVWVVSTTGFLAGTWASFACFAEPGWRVGVVLSIAALSLLQIFRSSTAKGRGLALLVLSVARYVCRHVPPNASTTRNTAEQQQAPAPRFTTYPPPRAHAHTHIHRLAAFCVRAWYGLGMPGLQYWLLGEVFAVIGGTVNVLRIPERWSPGTFDLVANSHNLMHIITGIALYIATIALDADRAWIYSAGYEVRTCLATQMA